MVAGAAEPDGMWLGDAVGGDYYGSYVAVLVAYAVDSADEDAVGDGVGALRGLPGGVLGFAVLGFFGGVPADGGGIEEGLGSGRAVRRAASGYHWSQQTSVPMWPWLVCVLRSRGRRG